MKLYLTFCLLALGLAQSPAFAQSPADCAAAFAKLEETGSVLAADLKDLKKLEGDFVGENHAALYSAIYQGKKVFVKVSMAEDKTMYAYKMFEKEVEFTQKLSDMKAGPHFYGTVKMPEGYASIVDYIPGEHIINEQEFAQHKNLINQNTLRDLEAMHANLKDKGIIPMDLQFRLDAEGHIWIIDPAFFAQKGIDVPQDFQKTGLGKIEKFIEYARGVMKQEE